ERERLRGIHGRGFQRFVGRHPGRHVRRQFSVQVDGGRRIGAGDDETAGVHDVYYHLQVARRGTREGRKFGGRAVVLHLVLDPFRIQLEPRIVFQRGLVLEQFHRRAEERRTEDASAPPEQLNHVVVRTLQRR